MRFHLIRLLEVEYADACNATNSFLALNISIEFALALLSSSDIPLNLFSIWMTLDVLQWSMKIEDVCCRSAIYHFWGLDSYLSFWVPHYAAFHQRPHHGGVGDCLGASGTYTGVSQQETDGVVSPLGYLQDVVIPRKCLIHVDSQAYHSLVQSQFISMNGTRMRYLVLLPGDNKDFDTRMFSVLLNKALVIIP